MRQKQFSSSPRCSVLREVLKGHEVTHLTTPVLTDHLSSPLPHPISLCIKKSSEFLHKVPKITTFIKPDNKKAVQNFRIYYGNAIKQCFSGELSS